MLSDLTWIGPFEGSGAYPTINRQLCDALARAGYGVLRNQHNNGLALTPLAIRHTYPLDANNVRHDHNVGLAVWEFQGRDGVPYSFQRAFEAFDLICAPSAWVCEQFRAVTSTPVRAIQWGVDFDEFSPDGTRFHWGLVFPGEDWVQEAEIVIAWLGGTDKRHGFDVAVKVMDLLPATWHLVAKQSVHYPPDENPHPRVHSIRVDLPSPSPFYRAADVFLQSARGVGFSLPVLEAIACGVPVASTDLPPLHEYANGRVVFAGGIWEPMGIHHVHPDCRPEWLEPNIEALAHAVIKAASIPHWATIPADFRAAWSWDRAAQRLMEIINE